MRHTCLALLLAASFAVAGCADGGPAPTVVARPATKVPTAPPPQPTDEPTVTPTASPTEVPAPELIVSTATLGQAGTVRVSVTGDVASGEAELLGRAYPLVLGAQSMCTFLGVGVLDIPGVYTLEARIVTSNGSTATLTKEITVTATDWTIEYLEFDAATTSLLDPAKVAAEREILADAYGTSTHEKRWDGAWVLPTDGHLTARFGEQRSINGSVPSGHHGGTDFGANLGTPIRAANAGVVVLARQLDLRGNMVIIDHGGGVLTGYGHMSAFAVAAGQAVEKGQVIGQVGSTGLSTGAHVHWEMSVHGILVDALWFTDGTNGF